MSRPAQPHADLSQDNALAAARMLRSLGNDRRLAILCRLGGGECSVSELHRGLDLSQSALSQHLARLRADGIVGARRQGRIVRYRIAEPAALTLIGCLIDVFCAEDEPTCP